MKTLPVLVLLLTLSWFSLPATITRGPYQQNQTPTSVTVVAKTDVSTTLALDVAGQHLTSTGTTHVFHVSGLQPGTSYPYTLSSWGSSSLETAPTDARAFRFLAWGDSGTGSSTQLDVAARMAVVPGVDFALGLGDLVYESGAAADFDPKLFRPYAELMHRMPFWPTLGNHDADTSNGAPFYDAFFLPTTSGGPGHQSGTERYYSFDYGSAHFVCLDSESSSTSPGSAQYRWAQADLAANQDDTWRVVFMHHPPYTRGSHNSGSESSLIDLREDLVPLIDAGMVDLVLAGHSHVYERSYLLRGGVTESTSAIVDSDPGEYEKPPEGAVYVVSGCGGKTSTSGSMNHPLMAEGFEGIGGFSLFDVTTEKITGQFIDRAGVVREVFEIRKGAPQPRTPKVLADDGADGEAATGQVGDGEVFVPNQGGGPSGPSDWIWATPAQIAEMPVTGPAWSALLADANPGAVNAGDQNEEDDSRTMAAALVFARTGQEGYRGSAQAALLSAIGTEAGSDSLAISRNLGPLCVAAQLIRWEPASAETLFRNWVSTVRTRSIGGRTVISTHEDRPNNWGTHAGFSRLAAAIYLGDEAEVARCAQVFRGWLGDRASYAGFDYGELSWHADPNAPVGINPLGSIISSRNVDGVLPDDQRRSGSFSWPPPHENYVYEALQGALAQAVALDQQGYDVWQWEDRALLRAFTWLHDVADFPADDSDDAWQPWLVNAAYGTSFPESAHGSHGKAVGWADWTAMSPNWP